MTDHPLFSDEAEQSVIGALLIDPSALERIGDELKPAHFYRDDHRRIFAAIQRLSLANKPFDVMAVHAELEESGESQQCGGMAYVFELANNTPSAANIRRYGEIVIERFDITVRSCLEGGDLTGEVLQHVAPPAGIGRAFDELLGVDARRQFEVAVDERHNAPDGLEARLLHDFEPHFAAGAEAEQIDAGSGLLGHYGTLT